MRVALADDHLLIINTLKTMIASTGYIELCGTYRTGAELLDGLQQCIPDVLLLDYHFPDQNGVQLARYISYHYPSVKILALTGFDKPGLATEMLENGCRGYLLKAEATYELILEALNRVYAGHIYLDQSVSDQFGASIRASNLTSNKVQPKLTNREKEILQYITAELSNQEIADKLCISRKTVENHRHSLMAKAEAKNTAGLVKFAIEFKLL